MIMIEKQIKLYTQTRPIILSICKALSSLKNKQIFLANGLMSKKLAQIIVTNQDNDIKLNLFVIGKYVYLSIQNKNTKITLNKPITKIDENKKLIQINTIWPTTKSIELAKDLIKEKEKLEKKLNTINRKLAQKIPFLE